MTTETLIVPVIHYANDNQAMRNAERAFDAGCPGVMLIEMQGCDRTTIYAAGAIKRRWPDRLVGLNFLNAFGPLNMPMATVAGIDLTWTDQQLTHSAGCDIAAWQARDVLRARADGHQLFCGVAFKYQQAEPNPEAAAVRAVELGFIPTTSGSATGRAADPSFIASLRNAIGLAAPLAIASGITPENAFLFLPHVSHVLVSTGVSSSFHEFDPARLRALIDVRDSCI